MEEGEGRDGGWRHVREGRMLGLGSEGWSGKRRERGRRASGTIMQDILFNRRGKVVKTVTSILIYFCILFCNYIFRECT